MKDIKKLKSLLAPAIFVLKKEHQHEVMQLINALADDSERLDHAQHLLCEVGNVIDSMLPTTTVNSSEADDVRIKINDAINLSASRDAINHYFKQSPFNEESLLNNECPCHLYEDSILVINPVIRCIQ
ncbi:hypothetical protein ACU5EH_20140 [Aliivibrio salmonicida]|uniref:hypothetical protein n=1 Tax=Aliivibrio salmonicida TaxID=40269 RepID=UPI00406C98C8